MDYSRLVETVVDALLEEYVYHATTDPLRRLPKIAKEGLVPNNRNEYNYSGFERNSSGRTFVVADEGAHKEWATDLGKERKSVASLRINRGDISLYAHHEPMSSSDPKLPNPLSHEDKYHMVDWNGDAGEEDEAVPPDATAMMTAKEIVARDTISPNQLDIWHANTGWTPLSAHRPESLSRLKMGKLDINKGLTKGQSWLFPPELYTEMVHSVVSNLLNEVNVLPDSVISKAVDGGWEKKEVAPGEVSPLAKAGIRSPRVNMGMKTPTTTFLPFAGLSPAVKETRARSGDESVRLVPGGDESGAVLLKTAPKAPRIRTMAAFSKQTPQEFTDKVGREHLIILGPAKQFKAGLEGQKAVFGHEAGHVINKDTNRVAHLNMFGGEQSDAEVVKSEEDAWTTGNALLKDMGITSDPHMEKAALHTYYSNREGTGDKANIGNLNPEEAGTLLHMLKKPETSTPNSFRIGKDKYTGPAHYMQTRIHKALGINEVTLPKDTSVEGINKGLDRAHAAWTKEMDTTTDLQNPKLAALSDNYVYFDQLSTAAGYPPEVAPQKMQKVLKQAKLQQAIKRK